MGRNNSKATLKYKKAVVLAIKSRGCIDCSVQYSPNEMTFDHLPGFTKRFTIGSAYSRETLKSLLKEILKCDLVCIPCHKRREYKRKG